MEEKRGCPICGSKNAGQIHDRVWSDENRKVYRCDNCLLAFLNPMMTEEEEKQFYAAYNEHTKKRGVTLTTKPSELHEKSIPEAQIRWKRVEKYFESGNRVLEVGSSTGAFLEICSKLCDCVCVEPDPENRKFAGNFSLVQYAYIEDIPDHEKFDMICLFHVFEHIRNPAGFLGQCRRILRNRGQIIIEVPHIEDPLLSLYDLNVYKDFYYQPMHHYVYSAKGLKHLFESHGFIEKDVIYAQRYGLDNHLAWLKNGKPGGDPEFKKLFGKIDAYCRKLERAKKTDTIFYIAVKER